MVLIAVAILGMVALGVVLAPRLAAVTRSFGSSSRMARRPPHPDWGGGRLSFPDGSPAEVMDSLQAAGQGRPGKTQVYSGQGTGVALARKSKSDYALTLALPSKTEPGRTGLFELASSERFRQQLFPQTADVKPPASDIPIYPKSDCRMQVGHGTDCFVGFYLTPDDPEAVREFYIRTLGRLGWQRVPTREVKPTEAFAKPKEDRTVIVQLRKQDSTTTRIGLVAMTRMDQGLNERK